MGGNKARKKVSGAVLKFLSILRDETTLSVDALETHIIKKDRRNTGSIASADFLALLFKLKIDLPKSVSKIVLDEFAVGAKNFDYPRFVAELEKASNASSSTTESEEDDERSESSSSRSSKKKGQVQSLSDTSSSKSSDSASDDSDVGTISGSDDERLQIGAKVEARYRGKEKWYRATITKVRVAKKKGRKLATYDLEYDDGDKEKEVARSMIRLLLKSDDSKRGKKRPNKQKFGSDSDSNSDNDNDTDDASDDHASELDEGTKVEARYHGKNKWYKATVVKVRKDKKGRKPTTYDLEYDDGDTEKEVVREMIRKLKSGDSKKDKKKKDKKKKKSGSGSDSSSSSSSDDDSDSDDGTSELEEGTKVEARYGGKDKWYKATVVKVRKDKKGRKATTYDLEYDDGNKDKRVARAMIRKLTSGDSKKAKKKDSHKSGTGSDSSSTDSDGSSAQKDVGKKKKKEKQKGQRKKGSKQKHLKKGSGSDSSSSGSSSHDDSQEAPISTQTVERTKKKRKKKKKKSQVESGDDSSTASSSSSSSRGGSGGAAKLKANSAQSFATGSAVEVKVGSRWIKAVVATATAKSVTAKFRDPATKRKSRKKFKKTQVREIKSSSQALSASNSASKRGQMSITSASKAAMRIKKMRSKTGPRRPQTHSAVSLDANKCAFMAVQIPLVDELPDAMAVRYPNANKNKIIGVPEHLMCGQYFMTPVPKKYLHDEFESTWMSVPISPNGPVVMIVHCPMRDTAFRIRVPKQIHNSSVTQFVVDLSQNVAEVARVQIPKGTKAGDSIVINLPKARINFGVVLPSGHYGKYITVRVPQEHNGFQRPQKLLALTDGSTSAEASHLQPDALVASNVEVQNAIREVFESIDVDGSGSIDKSEIKELLSRLSTLGDDGNDDVFEEIDENHDSVIDPQEFETYVLKQLALISRCDTCALRASSACNDTVALTSRFFILTGRIQLI